MAKYIDADTVVSMPFLDDSYSIEKHIVETDTIENLLDRFTKDGCPKPADVVPVVRCKDCRYLNNIDKEVCICYHVNGFGGVMPKDGFCSKGEREE